jgi:hypothetical protein
VYVCISIQSIAKLQKKEKKSTRWTGKVVAACKL